MTDLLFLMKNNAAFLISVVFLLGLVIGSFLNVVIYRLPIMMEREWREQCHALLTAGASSSAPETVSENQAPTYNLIFPRSSCPACKHAIGARDNIPVLSYVLLRGRCRHCDAEIPVRYPIVELVTGIMSAVIAWKFGYSWAALAALVLTWALIALSVIDLDHQLLPDDITLPLVWAGLLLSLYHVFATPQDSIIGGAAGYLSLWLVYHVFRLITGKEGMGFGDFKLFSLFGTWLGWQCLPLVILLSSLVGAIVGLSMILFRGRDRNLPIPFGPYIAAAGWLYLLFGDSVMGFYLTNR